MRFVTESNQIKCIRILENESGEISEEIVTTFDAHLEEISPHVMSSLSTGEQQQLIHWLGDRRVLKEQSIKQIILIALPGLLEEARNAIDKLQVISSEQYKDLSNSISSFNKSLTANKGKITEHSDDPNLKLMSSPEALREMLAILKKNY